MTQPASAEPRFLYVGGDPALDLINTVDWTSRGPEDERLESFEQLTRWAEGAGVIDACDRPAAPPRWARRGPGRPRRRSPTPIEARGTLRELFGAIARGEPAEPELARFNRLLREALAGLEVAPAEGSGTGYRWRWRGEESDPRALVWRVLWSAASLLQSDEVGQRAGVRRRRLRLDVRGPEPQRVPPLVSDADLRDPGEDPPPAGERLRPT